LANVPVINTNTSVHLDGHSSVQGLGEGDSAYIAEFWKNPEQLMQILQQEVIYVPRGKQVQRQHFAARQKLVLRY
jgi:hypothetical protein